MSIPKFRLAWKGGSQEQMNIFEKMHLALERIHLELERANGKLTSIDNRFDLVNQKLDSQLVVSQQIANNTEHIGQIIKVIDEKFGIQNLLSQQIVDNTNCSCEALNTANTKLDVIIDKMGQVSIEPEYTYNFEIRTPEFVITNEDVERGYFDVEGISLRNGLLYNAVRLGGVYFADCEVLPNDIIRVHLHESEFVEGFGGVFSFIQSGSDIRQDITIYYDKDEPVVPKYDFVLFQDKIELTKEDIEKGYFDIHGVSLKNGVVFDNLTTDEGSTWVGQCQALEGDIIRIGIFRDQLEKGIYTNLTIMQLISDVRQTIQVIYTVETKLYNLTYNANDGELSGDFLSGDYEAGISITLPKADKLGSRLTGYTSDFWDGYKQSGEKITMPDSDILINVIFELVPVSIRIQDIGHKWYPHADLIILPVGVYPSVNSMSKVRMYPEDITAYLKLDAKGNPFLYGSNYVIYIFDAAGELITQSLIISIEDDAIYQVP